MRIVENLVIQTKLLNKDSKGVDLSLFYRGISMIYCGSDSSILILFFFSCKESSDYGKNQG